MSDKVVTLGGSGARVELEAALVHAVDEFMRRGGYSDVYRLAGVEKVKEAASDLTVFGFQFTVPLPAGLSDSQVREIQRGVSAAMTAYHLRAIAPLAQSVAIYTLLSHSLEVQAAAHGLIAIPRKEM